MKIGICFGGYCPLTMGHLDIINKSRKECDKTFVVVCGYDNEPRALQIGMDLNTRYKIIKDFLTDDITSVISVNDTELGIDESCSIENWKIWADKVISIINNIENHNNFIPKLPDKFVIDKSNITFYVAESAYHTALDKLGYNCNLRNRDLIISSTLVRNEPLKYYNFIAKPFKKHFVKNILVIGTASEGKTMLCKDIANYFDIPWVDEYGREYMAERSLTDVDLTYTDFKEFLYNQNYNCVVAKNAAHRGLYIADSDNLVTLMYAYAYAQRDDMPNMNMQDYEKLYQEVKQMHNVKWDKIFILTPNNTFIDDGTRFQGQSSIEERNKNFEKLRKLVFEFYPDADITYLEGGDYEYNYYVIKHYINELL